MPYRQVANYLAGIVIVGVVYLLAVKLRPTPSSVQSEKAPGCDLAQLKHDLKSDEAFIDYAYCFVLGRPADPDGKRAWLGNLTANPDRGAAFLSFATCEEFKNTVYHGKQVKELSDQE